MNIIAVICGELFATMLGIESLRVYFLAEWVWLMQKLGSPATMSRSLAWMDYPIH